MYFHTLRDAWIFFPVNIVHFGRKKAPAALKKAFYRESSRNPRSSSQIPQSACWLFFLLVLRPRQLARVIKCVDFFYYVSVVTKCVKKKISLFCGEKNQEQMCSVIQKDASKV